MRKRRTIKGWYRQSELRSDQECEHCGTTIPAHSLAERRVVEERGRLVNEYVHLQPECPDRYYE
jgi:hypothetical protein